jgi:excisionase family DNA binding protein
MSDRVGADTREAARYLTPPEVAGWLRCSLKTVYRTAESDPTMPVLRLGKLVRFPRERLERWLAAREQGTVGRARRLRAPSPPGAQVARITRGAGPEAAPCAISDAIEPPPAAGASA